MLLTLSSVLAPETLVSIREFLTDAPFVDGQRSAGKAAARVKQNQELANDAPQRHRLNTLLVGQLINHPDYQAAALPHRIAVPLFARYTPGMAYGPHIDDPVMGEGDRYRSDIAITVFLNEPEEYEGGELVIQTTFGEQAFKLPAGDALLYPASSVHEIREVTSGERLVAVTWVQSLIREASHRELLFKLHGAREALMATDPEGETTVAVDQVYVNLVRLWSEL